MSCMVKDAPFTSAIIPLSIHRKTNLEGSGCGNVNEAFKDQEVPVIPLFVVGEDHHIRLGDCRVG